EIGMDLAVEGRTERIPPGSHICLLYGRVNEIPGVTAQLMRVGFTVTEKCLFAAGPAQVKELREELQRLQLNVDELIESGQLVLYEERDTFLAGGNRFDPYFLLSSHQTFIAQAL